MIAYRRQTEREPRGRLELAITHKSFISLSFSLAKALVLKEEQGYFEVPATQAGPESASLAKCLSL